MVAIIGGEPHRFRPLIDLYRQAGAQRRAPARAACRSGCTASASSATPTEQAADDFYPGWEQMFGSIGRERGFAPPTREQFDATCGPTGAYFIGDPETVADEDPAVSDALGGVARIALQMTNTRLAHDNLLRGIELLGTEVAPLVARTRA